MRLICAILACAIVAMPALSQSRMERDWPETDFSKVAVPFDEIMSGGVPRDQVGQARIIRRHGPDAQIAQCVQAPRRLVAKLSP